MNDSAPEAQRLHVGANIRRVRLKRGLTVKAFAEMIGRDPSMVWRLETGRQNGSMPMLQKIATALDVSYLELIAGTEYAA